MAKHATYPSGATLNEVSAQIDAVEFCGRRVVSGTGLAHAFGTTPSVVWAAILTTRSEGARIGFKFTGSSAPTSRSFAVSLRKLKHLTPKLIRNVIAWSASEFVQRCESDNYDPGFDLDPESRRAMNLFRHAHPEAVLLALRGRKAKDSGPSPGGEAFGFLLYSSGDPFGDSVDKLVK
jgi:hypothetical protein